MQVGKDGSLAESHLPIRQDKARQPLQQQQEASTTSAMLYKPHTPMELGDAVLGQLTSALVFVFDHMIPAVHSVVTWEADLTPLVPVSRLAGCADVKGSTF
jgi:hypothetical protein